MSRFGRFALLLSALSAALLCQNMLQRHLRAVEAIPQRPLAQNLAALPIRIGGWQGRDVPVADPRMLYADEHLNRTYSHATRQQHVQLWMAYSARGKDRDHHPEVCLPTFGKYEQRDRRQALQIAGDSDAILQYRFTSPEDGQSEWVFYWHYTFVPPVDVDSFSPLQRRYYQGRYRPASLTVEVFAPGHSQRDLHEARLFVQHIDKALQTLVPRGAVRDCQRKPVFVINQGKFRES